MRYFDLHCDTIYECLSKGCDMDNPNFHITPAKFRSFSAYIQCFAICVPEEIRGEAATKMFLSAYNKLNEQCEKYGIRIIRSYKDVVQTVNSDGTGAIFTVENSSPLAGKIENVELFSRLGVKFASLTWNGRNELGAGAGVTHSNGITPFGIEVVKEYEKHNIIVDVSHTSDRLFNDIMMYSSKPVAATHSNSRAVTDNKRNLTDAQFLSVVKKGGIVGINFFREFLNDNPGKSSVYDVLRHVEHFLSLGGENSISIGADFDGCVPADDIKGIDSIEEVYNLFLRENYREDLVKKIFFENAVKFCENFDK